MVNRPSRISDKLDETQSNLILRLEAWRSRKIVTRIGLPSLYCLVALVVLSVFAVESFIQQQTTHAQVLLVFALLTVGCFIHVRVTGNTRRTATMIVLLLGTLCLFLFYTGGINGTGPLWYFVFPLIALFIQRLWAGVIAVLLLLFITLGLTLSGYISLYPAVYTETFLERFFAVYLTISIISFFYAYARTSAQLFAENLNMNYRKLANTDDLTRLPNRRRMTEMLFQEVGRTRRKNGTFSLINFDIDYFKKINDRYGHDAGDVILKAVPEVIRSVLRGQDVCSRWGGEEFLILLPDTPLKGACHVAERLRKAFEQYRIQYGELEISVTVSVGVCEFDPASTLEDCIKQSDRNLYKAKASGRNCVIADPE
jgi:diguanylate cyclase (GGDEF)-like protein